LGDLRKYGQYWSIIVLLVSINGSPFATASGGKLYLYHTKGSPITWSKALPWKLPPGKSPLRPFVQPHGLLFVVKIASKITKKNVEPESRGIETLRENWSETAELEFIFSPRCHDAIGI
jgi:hypothetical protein